VREVAEECREAPRTELSMYPESSARRPAGGGADDLLIMTGQHGSGERRRLIWEYDVPPEASAALDEEEEGRRWLPKLDPGMAEAVRKLQERKDNAERREKIFENRQAKIVAKMKAAAEAAEAVAAEFQKQQELELLENAARAKKLQKKRKKKRKKKQREAASAQKDKDQPWGSKAWTSDDGWVWTHGVQFPEISANELWDMLVSDNGQVCPFLSAEDFIDHFMGCRAYTLNRGFSEALSLFEAQGFAFWSAEDALNMTHEPEELSRQQVAHLCTLHLQAPSDRHFSPEELLQEVLRVREWRAHEPLEAFGVDVDTYLRLPVYKRVLRAMSWLMRIPESILICEMAWSRSKTFHMPATLAALVLCSATSDRSALVSGLKFNANDMNRMCYAFSTVDVNGKQGIPMSRMSLTFLMTMRHMPKLVIGERKKRPHHWLWDKGKGAKAINTFDLTNARLKDKNRMVMGWTEFCILLVELFKTTPKYTFASPLHMCTKFLVHMADPDRNLPKSKLELAAEGRARMFRREDTLLVAHSISQTTSQMQASAVPGERAAPSSPLSTFLRAPSLLGAKDCGCDKAAEAPHLSDRLLRATSLLCAEDTDGDGSCMRSPSRNSSISGLSAGSSYEGASSESSGVSSDDPDEDSDKDSESDDDDGQGSPGTGGTERGKDQDGGSRRLAP